VREQAAQFGFWVVYGVYGCEFRRASVYRNKQADSVMKAVKASEARAGASTPSFSTSKGRANFARALKTTDRQKTVVGFARYNRPVAALVPVEAVAMLAGEGAKVAPDVRAKIVRMARQFQAGMAPSPKTPGPPAKRAKPKAAKKRPAKKAKKRAKARTGRR
jgi:hypothetical protein